jgi:citronellol/citronellal dehydrogenase
MSMCVLGMSQELRPLGIAVNALWPRTPIDTSAVRNLLGGAETLRGSRTPQILADAAHLILIRDSRGCTGNFFLDEPLLREAGVTDFEKYAVVPGAPLLPDFFLSGNDLP